MFDFVKIKFLQSLTRSKSRLCCYKTNRQEKRRNKKKDSKGVYKEHVQKTSQVALHIQNSNGNCYNVCSKSNKSQNVNSHTLGKEVRDMRHMISFYKL